ncbi:hypothetical protein AK812_SmicGene1815 [Symbiodinium microadriaticum]|uniref:Uncharacterized protein n=1 Tax=Symbiodinium microadriaticum TaxID=2951 RepID=A0A1Q9F335_SYMMI|nr:hypothetical protein AK812_SmicGene1815 [Symbiodinium microadriaticum]
MSHNFLVLKEIVDQMSSRDRLSSEPAESLAKMCVGWYTKHKNHYQNIKSHDAVVWAFKDAWILHKMFTLLRTKVMRPEEPRDKTVKQLFQVLLEAAALGQGAPLEEDEHQDVDDDAEDEPASAGDSNGPVALDEGHGAEALDEGPGPEALDEGPGAEALHEGPGGAEVVDRASLTRDQKIALDSAKAGYRLAHTTTETWTDEHMPDSPPEDPDPLASLGLQTQKTLLDADGDDADEAALTIESSPEVVASSSSAGPSTLTRFGSHMPKNPDQEDTYEPENSPDLKQAVLAAEGDVPQNSLVATQGDVPENSPDLDQAMVATQGDVCENSRDLDQAMVATEKDVPENSHDPEGVMESPMGKAAPGMDDAVSPLQAPATKDEQMRLILQARKNKKARAANKAIAADGKQKPPKSKDPEEAKPAKEGAKSKKAKEAAAHDEEPKPKRKREPKSKEASAGDPKPKAKPGPKASTDNGEPKPKRGTKSKEAKEAAANDQEPKPKPKRKREPMSKEAATDDDQEPKPKAKAKAKGGAMKKPAALRPAVQENDEPVQAPKGRKQEELPHTFARRAMPTGAHGMNKFRRIVGSFKELVLPKLKSGQRTSAEVFASLRGKRKAAKILAFACLLLLWNQEVDLRTEVFSYGFVESFAGNAEATKQGLSDSHAAWGQTWISTMAGSAL